MGRLHVKDKLKTVFNDTIENGSKYDENLKDIDFYNLFCKAASKDNLYKIYGNNFCMFNCYYKEIESILMIFAVPINIEEDYGTKQVAERVMKIVKDLEDCFITLEYLKAKEVDEDKVMYIICVKQIDSENSE